ncbi:methylase of polypeptide subunit release factors [Saccharopolyspora lacisalsi]|uniref:Methylase of polypeptide subunit release factors n=1 Tax=Halosaccharopolyspora lacisalsi TaxID=1000566 RepID=A0A839DZ76_9PSEU|nr:class I SAM-dependent methyltransferase [Halosaccharopolyspora lacisalsi]MBA8824521.1 methylase of polypeptide subunit release factors [Halosaccharopolyspora lacisalsi]
MVEREFVRWVEDGEQRSARWRSENGAPPPERVVIADDGTKADTAYRMACEGTAMLWRGDFQNARQLLQAMARRADRKRPKRATSAAQSFHLHRQAQGQRARKLAMLLIELEPDHTIALRRAPDVRQACTEAYGPGGEKSVLSLREILGVVGAHEWREKGVLVPGLDDRIHPHYGVFSPVRGEYARLAAEAPLPSSALAFDIGTGTGVLAAILARRGVERVVATDQDPRATACAHENLTRLGLSERVELVPADLFPPGRAPLIVCNPPWIPARPSSPLERGIYDPKSRMLHGFLDGLPQHLEPGGEGWLVLSDFAEHLGLRSREELLSAIDAAGLTVVERRDTTPSHPRASDETDPLHAARAAEVTSLWRLTPRR